MLKNFTVRNIALIDRVDLEFDDGLNVLSGETGAGKSVILEAVDFALGAKADKALIRSGETECFVRAEFCALSPAVSGLLSEFEIEEGESLIITRRYNADGRGSVKINGCPATSAMLKRLAPYLAEVHGQSEHFSLLKEQSRIALLDRAGGEEAERAKLKVKELCLARREIVKKSALLCGDGRERERRLDMLRFQIDEIERAELKEGEEEELLSLRDKLRNAEKILTGLSIAREAILSDGGSADAARTAQNALTKISKYGEELSALAERLVGVIDELSDIGADAEALVSNLDMDEGRLEQVEERLDEIRTVQKKYGPTLSDVLLFLARAKEEYDLLIDGAEQLEELSRRLKSCEKELFEACVALKSVRERAAAKLSKEVEEELFSLNIPAARFEIVFDEISLEDVSKATEEGLGAVRFLFSGNAGEPPKELEKIISGGEMSRLMLAVKARQGALERGGVYIFDEIDAGIGGKTARAVAEKFCKIAKNTQIIAISHLAQIASFSDREFLIEKVTEGEKTFTRVKTVEGEEKRSELARLLSGAQTEVSLRHADELLAQAEAYKNSL